MKIFINYDINGGSIEFFNKAHISYESLQADMDIIKFEKGDNFHSIYVHKLDVDQQKELFEFIESVYKQNNMLIYNFENRFDYFSIENIDNLYIKHKNYFGNAFLKIDLDVPILNISTYINVNFDRYDIQILATSFYYEIKFNSLKTLDEVFECCVKTILDGKDIIDLSQLYQEEEINENFR